MSTFDPAAATTAYLATATPAMHAKAQAYTQGGHWYLLGGWAIACIVAFLIHKSGVLARVSQDVQGRKIRPTVAVMACALMFSLVDFIIELPWSWFSDLRRNTFYGLSHQPLQDWLVQSAIGAAISGVAMALFLAALYALIRRSPKRWWLWGSGLAAVFVVIGMLVAPIYIEPIFNTYTPAPNGPVRDAIVALAKETGTPSDKIYIYNGSRQSDRYTANVSGLGGAARVAVSDTMFRKGVDLSEIRAVVGHEMGHYAHLHVLWGTLSISLVALLTFFGVHRLYGPVASAVGAPRAISDPVGLPALVIVASTVGLLMTPIMASLTRISEADADAFSFEHAKAPDGFARAMMKTMEYRAATPSVVEETLFYDHPSVSRRIRAAMDWKAAHLNDTPPGKP